MDDALVVSVAILGWLVAWGVDVYHRRANRRWRSIADVLTEQVRVTKAELRACQERPHVLDKPRYRVMAQSVSLWDRRN